MVAGQQLLRQHYIAIAQAYMIIGQHPKTAPKKKEKRSDAKEQAHRRQQTYWLFDSHHSLLANPFTELHPVVVSEHQPLAPGLQLLTRNLMRSVESSPGTCLKMSSPALGVPIHSPSSSSSPVGSTASKHGKSPFIVNFVCHGVFANAN